MNILAAQIGVDTENSELCLSVREDNDIVDSRLRVPPFSVAVFNLAFSIVFSTKPQIQAPTIDRFIFQHLVESLLFL